ncbi:MAG: hypothetical protein ABRQ38_17325 [Candidatus Eremiobacterota bacterium]
MKEHPWHEALTVSGIPEEYKYVRAQKCSKCGGTLEKKMQALLFSEEQKPYDLLTCECNHCHEEKKFYFDISSFFGKNI